MRWTTAYPEWGESDYFTVTLAATVRLCELLAHLYVLIPGAGRRETLLGRRRRGRQAPAPRRRLAGPAPGTGTDRPALLKHSPLVRAALAQLVEEDDPDPDAAAEAQAQEEDALEQKLSLHEQRLGAVLAVLKDAGAQRVLDLGCGEGQLLKLLLADKSFTQIVGWMCRTARWKWQANACAWTNCRRHNGSASSSSTAR